MECADLLGPANRLNIAREQQFTILFAIIVAGLCRIILKAFFRRLWPEKQFCRTCFAGNLIWHPTHNWCTEFLNQSLNKFRWSNAMRQQIGEFQFGKESTCGRNSALKLGAEFKLFHIVWREKSLFVYKTAYKANCLGASLSEESFSEESFPCLVQSCESWNAWGVYIFIK